MQEPSICLKVIYISLKKKSNPMIINIPTYHHFLPPCRYLYELHHVLYIKSRGSIFFLSSWHWSGVPCVVDVCHIRKPSKMRKHINIVEMVWPCIWGSYAKWQWTWELPQRASNPLKPPFSCFFHSEPKSIHIRPKVHPQWTNFHPNWIEFHPWWLNFHSYFQLNSTTFFIYVSQLTL